MSDFAPSAPPMPPRMEGDPRCPKCGAAGAFVAIGHRPAETSQFHPGKLWWPEHMKLDCLRCGYDMGRRLPLDAKEDQHNG